MRPRRPQMVNHPERECGSCQACCTWLRIDSKIGYSTRLDTGEDIAKPAGQACVHLTPKGCGIYDVRPVVCRRFLCDWRLGKQGYRDDNDSPLLSQKIGLHGTEVRVEK